MAGRGMYCYVPCCLCSSMELSTKECVQQLEFCCSQAVGIRFIGFRNEQAAGYAAAACGYLTGVPGVLLTVSGPGAVHGIAGLSHAGINCWPMIMLSGSSEQVSTPPPPAPAHPASPPSPISSAFLLSTTSPAFPPNLPCLWLPCDSAQ